MKSKILIIIAIIGFYSVSAWSQYTWAARYRQTIEPEWIVFDEQKNSAEPIFPYTFFFPPINRIGSIQSSSIKALGEGVYAFTIQWADGMVGNRMPTEAFENYIDCTTMMDGNLKDGIESYSGLQDLEWVSPTANSYVQDEEGRQRLLEVLKKKCFIVESKAN